MKISEILFHPFRRVAGGLSLVLGLVAIVLAALVAKPQGLHFDGVLDAHVGPSGPWWLFIAEGLIDWLSLALPLLLAGRLISQSAFRSIDLLGTQALARWPTVLIALGCLAPGFHRYTLALTKWLANLKPGAVPVLPGGVDAIVFGLVVAVTLACTVWMVALMWKSFSHCCNVRGGKAVVVFIVVLLIAEVLSKVLIGLLFKAV